MVSEIAELRKRLEAEYIAGRMALYGPASGWSKHAFIEARLRNMEHYHKRLSELVGPESAIALVHEVFERGDSLLREQRDDVEPLPSAADDGASQAPAGGEMEPQPASQGAGDDAAAPKMLWLLACSAGATADLLYLFYAAHEQEARELAHDWLRQLAPLIQLRALQPLPQGLTLSHGHYRGLIHLLPDGSLVEGHYFADPGATRDQEEHQEDGAGAVSQALSS
jgi:hypothetical protein